MSKVGPTATKTATTRSAGSTPQRAPVGGTGGTVGPQGAILGLQRAAGNAAVAALLHTQRPQAGGAGVSTTSSSGGSSTALSTPGS